jgi:hypothetical protein
MKYAMLVYSEPGAHDLPEDERAKVYAEYVALRDEPGYVDSGQLHPTDMATTLRQRNGETLTTDGPFADTKEVFGGFYVFDVDNMDVALETAKRIPVLRLGGSVEVRPLVEA